MSLWVISPHWMDLSGTELALMCGALLALGVLLFTFSILLVRYCRNKLARDRADVEGPAHADEYAVLQVVIQGHSQEAQLEVQTDAFESYEELRELVIDAIPNMFLDTDELTLEYMNDRSRWTRVKRSTPVATVKAARTARIRLAPLSRGSTRQ